MRLGSAMEHNIESMQWSAVLVMWGMGKLPENEFLGLSSKIGDDLKAPKVLFLALPDQQVEAA